MEQLVVSAKDGRTRFDFDFVHEPIECMQLSLMCSTLTVADMFSHDSSDTPAPQSALQLTDSLVH